MKFTFKPVKIPSGNGFDVEEALKTNTFICGMTGSGKTRLSWWIINDLIRNGVQVVVFDPLGVWKKSGIANIIQCESGKTNIIQIGDQNVVIDMSRLLISEQRQLLEMFTKDIFEERIIQDPDNLRPMIIVLEEAGTFVKNIKSKITENIFRLSMSGRNIKIRMLYISPKITIPTELLFLTNQRYYGQSNEQNNNNKIKSMTSKDIAEKCKWLKVGQFIYSKSPEIPVLLKLPEYKPFIRELNITRPVQRTNGNTSLSGWIAGISILLVLIWLII